MSDRVYYYPSTDALCIVEFDTTMGWYFVYWKDATQIYEPCYFKYCGFEYLGEL